jgi:hypothetical protein
MCFNLKLIALSKFFNQKKFVSTTIDLSSDEESVSDAEERRRLLDKDSENDGATKKRERPRDDSDGEEEVNRAQRPRQAKDNSK